MRDKKKKQLYRIPIISFIGKSNSGKTMLLEKLIPLIKERGYRVGAIKHHSNHGLEVDIPGKDSWRLGQAGAEATAVISPQKIFFYRKTRTELDLDSVAPMLGDVDIIFTEGFKFARTPKVEIVRGDSPKKSYNSHPELLALVSDSSLNSDIPCFHIDEINELADLIESKYLNKL